MSRQEEYANKLNQIGEEIDKKGISSFSSANFDNFLHKMQVEEENFAKDIQNLISVLLAETSAMEKVELIDYWKLNEYGRTNKKR